MGSVNASLMHCRWLVNVGDLKQLCILSSGLIRLSSQVTAVLNYLFTIRGCCELQIRVLICHRKNSYLIKELRSDLS